MKRLLLRKPFLEGALGAYWILCFLLTHLPVPAEVPLENGLDKVLHGIGYLVLSLLFHWNFYLRNSKLKAWQGVLILAAYGAIDEWTQTFVGRDCDFKDWVTDLGGIFVGMWLAERLWDRVAKQGE